MNPKVSILTPCYNGEPYLARFLDSILCQTYSPIELVLVNDGSVDKTEEVVREYTPKLERANIAFIYVHQKNQGQAAAIRRALQLATGKYVTWPDSDDFLTADSIEQKALFLENHPEHGFVRTDAYIYNETDLSKPARRLERHSPARFASRIFDRLLLEQNMYAMSGAYMFRMSALDAAIPGRDFFCSWAGQNWQLQLPIAYKFTGGYIDKPLFCYVIRENSHSRGILKGNMQERFERYDLLQELLVNTLTRIEGLDKDRYLPLVYEKYDRYKFNCAISCKSFEIADQYYKRLKNHKALRCSDQLRHFFLKQPSAQGWITMINKILFFSGIYYF